MGGGLVGVQRHDLEPGLTVSSAANFDEGALHRWGTDVSPVSTPTQVGSATWSSVSPAVFDQHTCATRTDGTVWCWGKQQRTGG